MLENKDIGIIPMLASVMIHEFKNPMALIQAEVDYIELGDKDKKYNKNFSVIKREVNRTNEMVTKWINTLDAPQQYQDTVCVYDEIMSCANYFLPVMNKSIEFRMNCVDSTLQILGNRRLFGIVISNIIKNSIEAIETEGIIEAFVRKEGDRVVIAIEDNGIGITDDEMEQIQGTENYTTKIYGSGLGVNFSRGYAEDSNGTYQIRNRDSGGCVVTMAFPAV